MELDFLSKYIRTADERNDLVNLLEELIENNFKSKPGPIEQTPFSQKVAEVIYLEINRLGISNNREGIEKFLEKLLKQVKELPEIRISIAIPATEKLMNNLKEWAVTNNFGNIIFNIEIKSDVLAGAVVMSPEGEYANYSVSSKLDKYFLEKQQEILSLLS